MTYYDGQVKEDDIEIIAEQARNPARHGDDVPLSWDVENNHVLDTSWGWKLFKFKATPPPPAPELPLKKRASDVKVGGCSGECSGECGTA